MYQCICIQCRHFCFFPLHVDFQLRHSDSTLSSLDCYNLFVLIIVDASKIAIFVKIKIRKFPSTSPIWRSSFCTKFVRARSARFKTFKNTGSIVNLNAYKKICFSGRRTFLNAKRNAWISFCSPLVPLLLFLINYKKIKKLCLSNLTFIERGLVPFILLLLHTFLPSTNIVSPLLTTLMTSNHIFTFSELLFVAKNSICNIISHISDQWL